jgi:DNA-binding GntR family transcriptional regulator
MKEDLATLKHYTDININQADEETIIETNDLFHQKIMKATNN